MVSNQDRQIIRELASQVAEIAALPIQEEKKSLWKKLNACKAERPMVLIDQVPWNELNVDDELTLRCADEECQGYERKLRRTLYQWKRFPVDMVVDPFVPVPMAVPGTRFDVKVKEETASNDPSNTVKSHKYENQFQTDEDLEKIRVTDIKHDRDETNRRLQVAHELFDGILEVRPDGVHPYISLWDPIASWMGVETALFAMIDRPDYLHKLLARMTDGYLQKLDQLEEKGLLCQPQSLIHCTGAYTDELPAEGYNPEKPRTQDIWMFGLAQIFSSASPAMFQEFEIDYTSRLCERFGLVYYGCCEPLDVKMDEVRKVPKARKVSMSPWVDLERGAEGLGSQYVFSRKPNPAQVAMEKFHPDEVREDLVATREACKKHGCSLEYVLKDVSTVRYKPERLAQWAEIAMEVAQA